MPFLISQRESHFSVATRISAVGPFLPARRHASAGTSCGPMSVCLCLSVTSWCSIKSNKRINLVFGIGSFFSTSPTLYFKEIQVSTKIRVLPSGTFSLIPDLKNSPRHIERRTCYQLASRKVDAVAKFSKSGVWDKVPEVYVLLFL